MKLIVSISTIPSRIAYLEPTIISLIKQSVAPDEIHIQLPNFSGKEDCEYFIPSFFEKFANLHVKWHNRDLGSSTKWFYPVKYLSEEEQTLLVIADDDCLYDQTSLGRLVEKITASTNTCFCFTGGQMSRKPEVVKSFQVNPWLIKNSMTILSDNETDIEVDTVQGFSLFIVRPYWFRSFDFGVVESLDWPSLNDDVVISGFLEFLSISRVQLGPYSIPEVLPQSEINPIHGDGRLIMKTIAGINALKQYLGIWQDVEARKADRNLFEKTEEFLKKIKRKLRNLYQT
ncbi:MAG: glycosyltransferase family A protein [Cyclobacteriaceae bacterium]